MFETLVDRFDVVIDIQSQTTTTTNAIRPDASVGATGTRVGVTAADAQDDAAVDATNASNGTNGTNGTNGGGLGVADTTHGSNGSLTSLQTQPHTAAHLSSTNLAGMVDGADVAGAEESKAGADGEASGGGNSGGGGGGGGGGGRGGMTVVTTAVLVDATLPRLSVNMRTATYRQILRLQASLADGGNAPASGAGAGGRGPASAHHRDGGAGGRRGGRGGGGAHDDGGDGADGGIDEEEAEFAAAKAAGDAAMADEDGTAAGRSDGGYGAASSGSGSGTMHDGLVKNRVVQCSFTAPHISVEIRQDRDSTEGASASASGSPTGSRSNSTATSTATFSPSPSPSPADLYVDGGGARAYAAARPLLRASVEGISGTLTKSDPLSEGGTEPVVEATVALRRMDVWDDYQTSGPDFAALVSSGGGGGGGGGGGVGVLPESQNLVQIDYVSRATLSEMAIQCDSLFFEWVG